MSNLVVVFGVVLQLQLISRSLKITTDITPLVFLLFYVPACDKYKKDKQEEIFKIPAKNFKSLHMCQSEISFLQLKTKEVSQAARVRTCANQKYHKLLH